MANKDQRWIYWDSCVFVSYLQKHPDRIVTLEAIWDEVAESHAGCILTSVLSITEVAYAVEDAGDLMGAEEIEALWNDSLVEVVEFNPMIARMARDIVRQGKQNKAKIGVIDAIHLATAQWVRQYAERPVTEFQTYDGDLVKRAPANGIPVCEPHVVQHRIPYPENERG